MKEKKRDTVGALSLSLSEKEPCSRDPIELEREMHKDYEKNVFECVDTHKKVFNNDFYIVVLTKKERLMKNVMRNYFLARHSCPTPDYDQTVYRYNRKEDTLTFMWVIPSRDTCHLLKDNAVEVVAEERQLLNYVLDFSDGTLMKLAKKLNNEIEGAGVACQKN